MAWFACYRHCQADRVQRPPSRQNYHPSVRFGAAATPGRRPEAVAALEEFAAAQHGYVTRAQAAQAGVGDVLLLRPVADGHLERWEHGIYRFRGTPDLLWAGVWVAWLRLDPEHDAVERARHPTEIARGP